MTTTQIEAGTEALASRFCEIINEWLHPKQLAEVNRRNKTPDYVQCCATHDFCDPNEAMAQAFREVMGRECLLPMNEPGEAELQADCDLMNEAWTIAKARGFKVNV